MCAFCNTSHMSSCRHVLLLSLTGGNDSNGEESEEGSERDLDGSRHRDVDSKCISRLELSLVNYKNLIRDMEVNRCAMSGILFNIQASSICECGTAISSEMKHTSGVVIATIGQCKMIVE